jgi:hypothetical protein
MGRRDGSAPRGLGWSTLVILTLGMGAATATSWSLFFRSLDSYGIGPAEIVQPARLAVYATQLGLVGLLLYALARWRFRRMTGTTLAVAVGAAWLLEGVVLTVVGEPLVANELDPSIAWYYWLAATAGPLQPAVAFVGGWFGLRHAAARGHSGSWTG